MLLNVQVLRAVAALLVVIVHLEVLAKISGLPQGVTVFGNSGVDLFFVISGLIMVVTTAQKRQTSCEFFRNRVTRIVPLYWLVTLSVTVIGVAAPALLQATVVTPSFILKSLVFVPYQRLDGAMEPIVFVGWTLNYEMAFYAIFASAMLLPRTLGLVLTFLVLSFAAITGRLFHFSDPILSFYTAPIVIEFGLGIVLGMLFVSDRLPHSPHWRLPVAVIAALAFAVMVMGPWLWHGMDRAMLFGVPAFVIVGCALIAERSGLALNARWLQLLGAASYSIYLTHFSARKLFRSLHST